MSPGNFDQTLERLITKAGVPRLSSHGRAAGGPPSPTHFEIVAG